MRTLRADGSSDEQPLIQASAQMELSAKDVPALTVSERAARLDDMAGELAGKINSELLSGIDKSLTEAGQTVSAPGEPFSVDQMFRVLERLQMDFHPDGRPKEIVVVTHPSQRQQFDEVLHSLHHEPAVMRRYSELIDRKREDWRDREAARKLVG